MTISARTVTRDRCIPWLHRQTDHQRCLSRTTQANKAGNVSEIDAVMWSITVQLLSCWTMYHPRQYNTTRIENIENRPLFSLLREIRFFLFLFVFDSNHSFICLRFRDIYDVNFSRSKPFRPFPVIGRRSAFSIWVSRVHKISQR